MSESTSIIGRWRITEMDNWDQEAVDLVQPGFIEFDDDGLGELGFKSGTTCSTFDGMETTARELNQHTARVLARVEAGETFTVTRNGRPLAILRPYGSEDPAVYPFRTDPMGLDDSVPTFHGAADFSERADELMAGFGGDE